MTLFDDGHVSKAVQQTVKAGGTPVLVMDRKTVREKYNQFRHELPGAEIHYALKANPDRKIARLLQGLGAGFTVASLGELELLLGLGVSPSKIVSSNPIKTPSFLRAAHAGGVDTFAFDSTTEVEKLSQLAPGSKVYLRLEVSNEGSEWPLDRKFGVETEVAAELLHQAQERGLISYGIAFHVGSQCVKPATWVRAMEKCKVLWGLCARKGVHLRSLNIGGGFPVSYTRPVPSIGEIALGIKSAMQSLFPEDTEMVVEPGRALVGDAGVLVTSVIAKASRDGQSWLYLDAGVFNGLMETVGGIRYSVMASRAGAMKRWVLAGPSCDSMDALAGEFELPELEVGDNVYILSAGAYTTAYASRFDGFEIPRVRLV